MTAPIYVPSKGRPESITAQRLEEEGLRYVLAVPRDEVRDYESNFPHTDILVTPAGIGPSRQAIREWSAQEGEPWHWQIDDDMKAFFSRDKNGHMASVEWKVALDAMEQEVARHPTVVLAGPQFRQFAWSGPDLVYNIHPRNVLYISADAKAEFWPYVKEDLDFALQALTRGQDVIRFNAWAMSSPHMSTTKGGCWEDYQNGALADSSRRLMAKWGPDVMSLRDNGEYLANVVKWKRFRRDVPIRGDLSFLP